MKLITLSSGSKANGYVLTNGDESLIIECGMPVTDATRAIGYKNNIVGCVVSHEHKDHSKYIGEYIRLGYHVYTSKGTCSKLDFSGERKPVEVKAKQAFMAGNFKIIPFPVIHDVAEPFGYVISHKEMGNLVFLTDTAYSPYKFKGINHIMVEANFVDHIMDENIENGEIHSYRAKRTRETHMSLDSCIELLDANDLSKCYNIVLIHLSKQNSDSKEIRETIYNRFRINTEIATRGLTIELSKYDNPDF